MCEWWCTTAFLTGSVTLYVPEHAFELPTTFNEKGMEVSNLPLSPTLPPPGQKASKKQAKLMRQKLEKMERINIHLHALFAAIEHGHLEKARTILESTDVDVNSLNSDKLSPLDVAVLSNNKSMVKMLIQFGAREGNQFGSSDKLGNHLSQLLGEAEMRLQEFGYIEESCSIPINSRASFSSFIGTAYPASAMTGCAGGDNEKQAIVWDRRAKTLKKLVLGFTQARPPDQPSIVALDITGCNSVVLRLQEPTTNDSPITTKFKVQWSTRADFAHISGEKEIFDMNNANCVIDLTQGRRYFFRASCGNLKGYGTYVSSTPESVVPSSWREVDSRESR
ncbi:Ankyrin repeats (3 copies) [Popillia japonica]|uniref:Ankyrin repeats (3 copies) n=1 Tax=Popillia japonica TaxID=7064 RepID=A0AAW1KH60_POPJA